MHIQETFGVYLDAPDAKMPVKNNESDAGFDLYSIDHIEIQPGTRVLADTGIILELKQGWEAQIRPRSGLALKQGLMIVNSPGTIDSSFRGRIKCILYNSGDEIIIFDKGSKIAQMVIKEVPPVKLVQLSEKPGITERNDKGFGSSGIK